MISSQSIGRPKDGVLENAPPGSVHDPEVELGDGVTLICGQLRYHFTASASFSSTPSPLAYATPGAPPGLVALLFLSTCRNYKVSDERSHRIAIQAELIEDMLSQMICVEHCVKHRRFCAVGVPHLR